MNVSERLERGIPNINLSEEPEGRNYHPHEGHVFLRNRAARG